MLPSALTFRGPLPLLLLGLLELGAPHPAALASPPRNEARRQRRRTHQGQRRESQNQAARALGEAVSGKDARPLLQLAGKRPMQGRKMLIVSHLYRDIFYLLDILEGAGLAPQRAQIVGTVYPFQEAVKDEVRARGYALQHDHVYDIEAFERSVEKELRRVARQQAEQPVIILDDGGTAARLIAKHFGALKCSDGRPLFEIVEVTRNGVRAIEDLTNAGATLPFGYSTAAQSPQKRDELSPAYSDTALQKAASAIAQAGLGFAPRLGSQDGPYRIGVQGAGAMGAPAILRLADAGFLVTAFEKDPKQRQVLRSLRSNTGQYFEIAATPTDAIYEQHMIIGTTGELNVLGPEHLPLLRDGAIVFQLSSKRNDFDMDGFEARATAKRELPRHDGLPQRSFTYVFDNVPDPHGVSRCFPQLPEAPPNKLPGRREVHFIGDGWTVNHNGSLDGTSFVVVQQELDLLAEQILARAAGQPLTNHFQLTAKTAPPGSPYRTNLPPLRGRNGEIRNELLPSEIRKMHDAYEATMAEFASQSPMNHP